MSDSSDRKTPYQRWVETGREQTYTEWLENELKATESKSVGHKLTGGPVYECESREWGWGIRNKHGLVCKVFKPSKFGGQDERFTRETEEFRSVVEFIISSLNGATLQPKPVEVGEVDWQTKYKKVQNFLATMIIENQKSRDALFAKHFEIVNKLRDELYALRTQPQAPVVDESFEQIGWTWKTGSDPFLWTEFREMKDLSMVKAKELRAEAVYRKKPTSEKGIP